MIWATLCWIFGYGTSTITALGRLIDAAKLIGGRDGKPLADADLVRRAANHRYTVSKSNLARLRSEDSIESMSKKQVDMLAAALDLPRERIVAAFLDAMGLRGQTADLDQFSRSRSAGNQSMYPPVIPSPCTG